VVRNYHKVIIDDRGESENKLKKVEGEGHKYITYHVSDRVKEKQYHEIVDLINGNNMFMKREDKIDNPRPDFFFGSVGPVVKRKS